MFLHLLLSMMVLAISCFYPPKKRAF